MNGRLILAAAALAVLGIGSVQAAVRTVCGERQGTAGNAWLSDRKGGVVLEMARQGGDQRLLDEADGALPARRGVEAGTQVGRRYCLTVRYGAHRRPLRVLAAKRS
ncbi:hypothetical protein D3273_21175 [Lichenibacterium minor]|uniref:Uncharacterized protein n=1 Tax=Lichenibacterium minor TaxID=2316528 RepID=A0A4Q2U134_9HYPH|nr:hypothetical protein [Lichenibacterium minor]RYC29972.1 hypothetical protein D3273_21175 [Lichenibacterium minor]